MKFLGICSFDLHTRNKLVTLWVNCISNGMFTTLFKGPLRKMLDLILMFIA